MGTTDRFSPEDVQRILGLTGKQLDTWDRLRLVSPRTDMGSPCYDFRDLIGLRTVKQLVEKGVSANRLQRTMAALHDNFLRSTCRSRSFVFFPTARTSLLNARERAWSRYRASSY